MFVSACIVSRVALLWVYVLFGGNGGIRLVLQQY